MGMGNRSFRKGTSRGNLLTGGKGSYVNRSYGQGKFRYTVKPCMVCGEPMATAVTMRISIGSILNKYGTREQRKTFRIVCSRACAGKLAAKRRRNSKDSWEQKRAKWHKRYQPPEKKVYHSPFRKS